MAVFWVVAPWSLVEVYQRFRGPCCLHQRRRYNPEDSHLRTHRRENLKSYWKALFLSARACKHNSQHLCTITHKNNHGNITTLQEMKKTQCVRYKWPTLYV
jgi:hypothetical protein